MRTTTKPPQFSPEIWQLFAQWAEEHRNLCENHLLKLKRDDPMYAIFLKREEDRRLIRDIIEEYLRDLKNAESPSN